MTTTKTSSEPLCPHFGHVGRNHAISTISYVFTRILKAYTERVCDRNEYAIPVCPGMKGIGKTRLLKEGYTIVKNVITQCAPDQVVSIIAPYANDNKLQPVEAAMSIEASFAWRLLYHSLLAGNSRWSFAKWMKRVPMNSGNLGFSMAIKVLYGALMQENPVPRKIFLFIGIDDVHEVLRLKASAVRTLVQTMGTWLSSHPLKNLVIFPMFAGTMLHAVDLTWIQPCYLPAPISLPMLP